MIMKKQLLLFLSMLLPLAASADAVEIDGIYYNLISKVKTAEVTTNPLKYKGKIIVPETITYDGINYSVTSIGEKAFSYCPGLTSIEIPSSITSIGTDAFNICGLTKVIIRNIAAWCEISFYDSFSNPLISANHLYDDNNTEIKDLVIPNSVTSIGNYAFSSCTGLTSVTIPNSVTSIGDESFRNCTGLTSVTIPNSVTSIRTNAFYGCTGLTSVTIGSGINNIGICAFASCQNLTDVYCYAVNVPYTGYGAFEGSNTNNAALHVPEESVNAYRTTSPWSGFKEIVAIKGDVQLFTLSYYVDGLLYKTYELEAGTPITPEAEPTKEGYTFSGWSEIPETMPAHDVTVTGTFTLDTGIEEIMSNANGGVMIFIIDGKRVDNLKKGMNVIRMKDGTTRKVVVK